MKTKYPHLTKILAADFPAPKGTNLPSSAKREMIKDLYAAIAERMFGLPPEHIQWMNQVLDKVSDSEINMEWDSIQKGNVHKFLEMVQLMRTKQGIKEESVWDLEQIMEDVADGIIKTKEANQNISPEAWKFAEDHVMDFVDKMSNELKALPDKRPDAKKLPGKKKYPALNSFLDEYSVWNSVLARKVSPEEYEDLDRRREAIEKQVNMPPKDKEILLRDVENRMDKLVEQDDAIPF